MKSIFSHVICLAVLLALQPLAEAGPVKDHAGRWLGDLKTPGGRTLRLGAELFTRADGSAWASVASPDQDAIDIPVTSIEENGDTIELTLPFAALTLTWAKDHFKGVWKQGEAPLAFELRKVGDFPMKVRPQTPKAPFPYKNEALAISTADGVTLGATLSIPHGVTRPNVVVLVAGSGPATRDGHGDAHRPFAVLADHLARRGIAVLRYDKRGVARSTGNFEKHTLADLIDDLDGVVRTLKARNEFNHLGLVGHSEGSPIAAAVAARHPESVGFVVSLAGVGLPGLDALVLQDWIWAKDRGASPAEADWAMAYARKFYEVVLAHTEPGARVAALKALYDGLRPAEQDRIRKLEMNQGTLSLAWAQKPFLRASLQADPSADWRAVRCPVLALNGALDHQVPAKENLRGIVAALNAGGNRRVESDILPSLNHAFQTAVTGREDEYGKIDETLSPVALERIVQFAQQQR
ncbi:alpha/beta hydrolase family protein [Massilia niabensis]|uniref:Alpha/beta hydrolase family protein n=1 Tax=Massilia niabensis TaxID=544910 RepID=A0ABW0L976_9BURK